MDERQIVDSIGKLTGVVTALEMQLQAVLLAALKAGMEVDDVRQVIRAMPDPVVPSLGRDAYDQAMAGFERRLEQAALRQENDLPEARKGRLERLLKVVRRR